VVKVRVGSWEVDVELPLTLNLKEPTEVELPEPVQITVRKEGSVTVEAPCVVITRKITGVQGEIQIARAKKKPKKKKVSETPAPQAETPAPQTEAKG
jgi:hypothetical protein